MGKKDVTATTTFREFFDARRNSDGFQDRVDEVLSGTFGMGPDKPAIVLKLVAKDQYTFGDDAFEAKDVSGARELVAAYALYRRKVIKAGGEPTAFERPTKDGWE